MSEIIRIKGARVHNLRNIDIDLPRNKLIVITGLSGSGKSSLAFDTIYAEGQRRYVESLSAYARQFIGLMDKPDVDLIEGLSPAISIDQKSTSNNPRSTVGTITEIYDYLRLLFARIGVAHCPECGKKIGKYSIDEIVDQIFKQYLDEETLILSPLIRDQKGEHKTILERILKAGFTKVRFDGEIYDIEELLKENINKQKKHHLEIIIDQAQITNDKDDLSRIRESIEKAIDMSNGLVLIANLNQKKEEQMFSRDFACPDCDISIGAIEPRSFSFNSPHGACEECSGLGTKLEIDPELLINPRLTIAQGAIRPWSHGNSNNQTWLLRILGTVACENGFDLNTKIEDLSEKQMKILLYGTGDQEYNVEYESKRFEGELNTKWEGIINNLERRYKQTDSDYIRKDIGQYMRTLICQSCGGERLKREILAVRIEKENIASIARMTIANCLTWFNQLEKIKLSARDKKISTQIIKEIKSRLNFLLNVGLDYLTLDRAATTLSGGEAQRIRLATQIGSSLVGVLYILDEPSIGLHQRDNYKLINTLKKLRDLGNTVIVVEHDAATMEEADFIVDIGPGAGRHGGQVTASGTLTQIKKNKKSLTGKYLTGKENIPAKLDFRAGNGHKLKIIGAREHNLKNINVDIPLGRFVAITGVSGSGKSTLMTDILARALNQKFYRSKQNPGKHEAIEGLSLIDKVVNIDQSPIGRTPRSNPATYTGAFTPIRELFASLPESKLRGYKAGRFSFNVTGGRCEACAGDGMVKIEMQFLPDVYVECEVCGGKRYNKEALEIFYKNKNISDCLNMTVNEAVQFFRNIPGVYPKLKTLVEVGLGYIKLGQSATTLSGGEAQRIKLATELSRTSTGKTLYILDEPTTGLHFEDIKKLLNVLNQLVDKGNTVLVIEHNLDVIKSVDWIIDLGPEGGEGGGEIVASGTPYDIIKVKESYTGKFLKEELKKKK